LGRIAAWAARVPVIVQTPHGHVFYGHFSPFVSRLFLFLERLAARITDCIVALTDRERSEYQKLGLIRNERLAVIHSGVSVDRYRVNGPGRQKTRKALEIDADACVVGSVGWLLPIKGPHYLLEAVAPLLRANGKIQLLYVGKGEMEAVLKGIVEQRGLEKSVRFLGWRNNVPDLLSVFDIFVLPSLNEGMGRVLIEAMAAGLPIVASRTGGIPDLIIHGENGLLVPPADPRRLGAAIEFLVRHPEERRRIGGSGRLACAKYSTTAMVAKIESLYRRLLHCKQIPCC
jgi:glycosyltransferase involved in cell wall biosynthesis